MVNMVKRCQGNFYNGHQNISSVLSICGKEPEHEYQYSRKLQFTFKELECSSSHCLYLKVPGIHTRKSYKKDKKVKIQLEDLGRTSLCWCSTRCQYVRGQVDASPSNRDIGKLARACPAHKIGVKKHNNHCDIIVEMPTNPAVNFFQVRISHFSLLCCFLKGHFHQPLCNSLRKRHKINHIFILYRECCLQ